MKTALLQMPCLASNQSNHKHLLHYNQTVLNNHLHLQLQQQQTQSCIVTHSEDISADDVTHCSPLSDSQPPVNPLPLLDN